MNLKNKICKKCLIDKPVEDFYKSHKAKDGYRGSCKECVSKTCKLYYDNNAEWVNEKNSKYRNLNPRPYTYKPYDKNYYENNKENIKLNQERYKQKNIEIIKEKRRQYKQLNKEKIRAAKNKRLKTDINFKLRKSIRNRLQLALKHNYTKGLAFSNLGCSLSDLKLHIEKQFKLGMTWDNWRFNGWHLDHIKPLCSFDLTNPEQLKIATHYTNLQPLWAKENLSKNGKNKA